MTDESGAARRALVISGTLGHGHDSVARAVVPALQALSFECDTVNALDFMSKLNRRMSEAVWERMFAIPTLYDAIHFTQLNGGGRVARAGEAASLRAMKAGFEREVSRVRPELLFSVFATGAAVAARYRRTAPSARSVVLVTEHVAHHLWVHEGTDLFLVTSELGVRSVRRYLPKADARVVTPPVRPGFFTPPSRESARSDLGLREGHPCVLLMAGSLGRGPMVGIARALAVAGYEVLAVAGNNERLERRLRDVSTGNRGLQVFGFVDDMPSLMAACDVFVTTPGVSCWEARAMGRPIVLFDSTPGHGRENLLHELELGGAAVSSPQPKCVLEAVSAVVESSDCAMPEPWDPKAFARDLGDALGALGRPSL